MEPASHIAPPPRFLIPPGEPCAGDVVLSRFRLIECVGEGAQGVVWRAFDPSTGGSVALKFATAAVALPSRLGVVDGAAAEPAPTLAATGNGGAPTLSPGTVTRAAVRALRREVAALRLLHIPGLVGVIDAGTYVRTPVIAMDWVAGRPFPGPRQGARWSALERAALVLLETLQRVHGAGLVHRDLKPSNVLIDADGLPVLLDLGVAGGAALRSDEATGGTPRYQPPEVLAGAPADPSGDLFALGVMLFEALAGQPLRGDDGADQAALAPSAVIARLEGRAPSEVAEWIAALLDPDLATRLKDAERALHALLGARSTPEDDVARLFARCGLTGERVEDDAAFAPLIEARERIVRDRSTAARALFIESNGNVARARAAMRAWLRAGIGRLKGDRLTIAAHDVQRLQLRQRALEMQRLDPLGAFMAGAGARPAEPHVSHDDGPAREPLRAWASELERELEGGDPSRVLSEAPNLFVLAVDDEVARAASGAGGDSSSDDLLKTWLRAAVASSNRPALEDLLHAIDREAVDTEVSHAVGLLAQAGIAGLQGSRTRASELLDEVSARPALLGGSFRLTWCRHAIALMIARATGPGPAEAALAQARAWAATTGRPVPAVASWLGWNAYVMGDFRAACEAHMAAARSHVGGQRAAALVSAAQAALNDDQPELALECALEAEQLTQGRAELFVATRAVYTATCARYALCEPLAVDDDLVELAREIDDALVSPNVLLGQTVIAWRTGHEAHARTLCRDALHGALRSTSRSLQALTHALAVFLAVPEGQAQDLSIDAPPGILLQIAALQAVAETERVVSAERRLQAAWAALATRTRARRREVLSLDECRDLLERHGVRLDP
ncbi:MAG: serine/threonine-protein kinase [Planctomycetota bacterium]